MTWHENVRIMYAIVNDNGNFYRHGYPSGQWVDFPGQLFGSKGAATRRRNALGIGFVVAVRLESNFNIL